MVKVLFGEKGVGKTKTLLTSANTQITDANGDVVFISKSNQLVSKLDHKIRFINVNDYPPVSCEKTFLGFICGILSEDYDIEKVFIDGIDNIISCEQLSSMEGVLEELKQIGEKHNVEFFVSMSGKSNFVPQYLTKYEVSCVV